MKYSRLRGTQDIIPPAIYLWRHVERVFARTFERFGYQGIRTPLFESTELFQRAVGEHTDIISKEMYTFTDRGGRSVTLRPENTASVVRAYLENGMHRLGGIARLCYAGPMFRYERPQAGRFRQFHQVGVEALGSMNPMVDVEVMDVVMQALDELGFRGLTIRVNSVGCPRCRAGYRSVLVDALNDLVDRLCTECRERLDKNPMRVFDCKQCEAVKPSLPTISAHLCEECGAHFQAVARGLETLGLPYEVDPRLVRGLDYYTKTTFEIIHGDLGAQNALCGGGRYDTLVEECGGPPTPAVGFSAGLERIISVLPGTSPAAAAAGAAPDFYVVCSDEESSARALTVARTLRTLGNAVIDFSGRAVKRQMRNAEQCCAPVAVLIESGAGRPLVWKDMASREQFELADEDLLEFARTRIKPGKGD